MYVALENDEDIFTTPPVRQEIAQPETDKAAESSITECPTTTKGKSRPSRTTGGTPTPPTPPAQHQQVVGQRQSQRQSQRQRQDKAAAAALTAEEPPDQQPVDHDAGDHTNRNAGGDMGSSPANSPAGLTDNEACSPATQVSDSLF